MVDLTEEYLMECMRNMRDIPAVPTYFAVSYDFMWVADRILNPWKGKRASWLKRKK